MRVRRPAILAGIIVAVITAAAIPAIAAKSYRAERFHSRIVVEPGGSILVTETVRFEFGPDSFTYVYRDLPTRKTDGLTILSATMDGVPMERGKAPGQFELKREDNRRRIVWHFAATSSAAHVFSVTYRAAGVVWQDAGRDVLVWTLLPKTPGRPDKTVAALMPASGAQGRAVGRVSLLNWRPQIRRYRRGRHSAA